MTSLINDKTFVKLSKENEKKEEEILLKLMEEVGESTQAFLSLKKVNGSAYKESKLEDFIEELVDIKMIVDSIIIKMGAENLVDPILEEKIKKWEKVSKIK